MTNPHKTHISIVVDRSGSMNSVKEDAAGAINNFIDEQKKVDGECSLFFVDFDSDAPFFTVHNGPLAEMEPYTLTPRNLTPLLYAVGKTIDKTGEQLAALPEDERPGKVIFVIQTDGLENYSHQIPGHPYAWDKVAEMIKVQKEDFNWQFIFLGMGADSWSGGQRLGVENIVQAAASNAASYANTYDVMNVYASAFRGGQSHDMSAMRGMRVNAQGRMFNAAGEEVDPKTGDVVETPTA